MTKIKIIHTGLMVALVFMANISLGQDILTQADIVRITLENNYNIKIAKNDVALAENNTRAGATGYLPTVNASTGANGSLGSSRQLFSNGNENVVINSFNWGANASVGVNYTILDKTRSVTLNQLKEVAQLSDLQLRQTIENNLIEVFANYFEVARLTANERVQEQTLEVSEQRLLRAKYQYDYGQGIRLDVLNAEVDIKRDSINLLNLRNQLRNARRNLNVAMGRVVTTPVEVDTLVEYQNDINLDQLIGRAQNENILVELIEQNLAISAYDLKLFQAARLPTLGANTSYDFNFSDNAPGAFIDLSTNRGLGGALTVSWNIFDGGLRRVQRDNARINIESQTIQREQILQQLERDVINAWENYQNALFILQAEAQNLATNRLNFQRTEEQFRVGQINSVEFRQAQLNLLDAATNYNTAKFDAKIIELQLIQLSGGLLDLEL
jgi:outer membrane protein